MNKSKIGILLILVIILNSCNKEKEGISLTFTGDVILDRGVMDKLQLYGDSILLNSLKNFQEQDYFIINYEGTFTDLKISQDDKYNFKVNKNKASLLKKGGITHASVANNHSFDYGEEGYQNTIEALTQNNIIPLGETCEPELFTKGKYKCAVLSVSLTSYNELFCISSIDKLKKKVIEFNNSSPSVPLILYIHWGLELQPAPEKWQTELANELVELGVDAIIGHHPHIVQTVDFINNVPVFYSIGNFIADAYLPLTNKSIVVNFTIKEKIEEIHITPVDLESYFPKIVEQKEQIDIIHSILTCSNKIALINNDSIWLVKPAESVDFSEDSKIWIFPAKDYSVVIKQLSSGQHKINLWQANGISPPMHLYGKLSELEIDDVDNDGKDDILIGVSKKVKFDPIDKKRINVYTVNNGALQRKWMGTKFIYDIYSFKVYQSIDYNYLKTIEKDSLGNTYEGIYEWDDFGFALNNLKQIKNNENN